MEKICLIKLVPSLRDCFVLVKKPFLKQLLNSVSKEKKAYRDKNFVEAVGYKFNNQTNCSPGLYNVFRGKKSTQVRNLEKILSLSNYNWRDVERNLVYLKAGRRRGHATPKFPIVIDKDLGSVVGHILGDGSIDGKYSQIFFSNTNKELLLEFQKKMFKIFGVEPRIWVQKKRKFEEKSQWIFRASTIQGAPDGSPVGLFYPKICGKILNTIFRNFALGEHKEITLEILKANRNFKQGLIKAFFDDEGSVYPKQYMMRLYQDDKQLLINLQKLLQNLGVTSNPIRFYFKGGKRRHYFNITKLNNHKIFFEKISFCSLKKRNQLALLALK